MNFPIFKTKVDQIPDFDLSDPKDYKEYFQLLAGPEIEKIKESLKNNSFIAYFLGKKNSGKGTYAKMVGEMIGEDKISHFSIGDMVREIDSELQDTGKREELISFLKGSYRGWIPLEKIISSLENRSTKTLLPSELILALVKREISKREKKSLFIDGFPREMDQISYSLFFRDLIGYRDDPDIFVLIDVPETVIDERIKGRVVCPKCKTPRNLRLLRTKEVGYDKEFFLICDNPGCQNMRMIQKEGDQDGIGPLRERLDLDEKLIKQAFNLHGIPKILLRNSVPVNKADEYLNKCDITPAYNYEWDEENKGVKVIESPWVIKDDEGIPSYSLMPPAVAVSLIKQLSDVFH